MALEILHLDNDRFAQKMMPADRGAKAGDRAGFRDARGA